MAISSVSHFDSKGFEPIIPTRRELELKKEIYKWSDGSDGYPPHLQTISQAVAAEQGGPAGNTNIFDMEKKDFVQAIGGVMSFIIPEKISAEGTPYVGPTLADCEKYNIEHKSKATDVMDGENIANNTDWYSDARFAQQHFSGVNPTTIETAPADKVKAYVDEATKQELQGMKDILSEGKDILIQDYSYFREATGLSYDETFVNEVKERDQRMQPIVGKPSAYRHACASIIIFQLHSDGRLHPLAITLDYRGPEGSDKSVFSLDKSITIFNRRLTPDDKGDIDEKDDWAWRYSKTCAQTADWARHEIAVHLVDTHLVEEAIVVATNRTIPEEHILYEILSPHWFRTLALNSAARTMLVPAVINRISGLGPDRVTKLVDWSYKNFNFQEKYIPNDLKKRGFNPEAVPDDTPDKYRNYPYATDMYLLWGVIRDFVNSVLATKYKSDQDIHDDPYIGPWCTEIQEKGQLKTFPTITTVDQLVDAVTMCIHIASPQHTAVNYLQDYYYSFVPSKPPALCTPLPKDLQALQTYTEKDLTDALPIGTEGAKWKDWLLAAQMPELLSYKVESRYNLITYAKSLYNVNKNRTAFDENEKFDTEAIKEAAAVFYSRLRDCELAFRFVSANQTEGTIPYPVLEPELTAVSILI